MVGKNIHMKTLQILRSHQLRHTVLIAVIVGTLLTLVNEGREMFLGFVTIDITLKIIFNYLTPLVVANLGWFFSQKGTHHD